VGEGLAEAADAGRIALLVAVGAVLGQRQPALALGRGDAELVRGLGALRPGRQRGDLRGSGGTVEGGEPGQAPAQRAQGEATHAAEEVPAVDPPLHPFRFSGRFRRPLLVFVH